MKKILSFFAAALVAIAVNAQTDFASPYYCTADAGVISGDAPSNKVYLNESANPHQIEWSDVSKTYTAVITWQFDATTACYLTVGLDLGTAVSSNKHIFEVKLLDANNNELGALEEGPAYTGDGFTEFEQVKTLSGKLLIPAAGNYKIELRNNRDFCKGSIRNIILTYAGVAPITDFATPGYACTADDAVITGDAPSNKVFLNESANPHQIEWSDVSKTYTAAATWKFIATRGCYVSVALDLGTAVASNKHIFDVELLDAEGNVLDTIAEGPDYTGDGFTESEQVKTLSGTILVPEAGNYTLRLMNHRDFCKGSIKNVILTYAADAPAPAASEYYIKGTMNEWQLDENYKMTLNEAADDVEYMIDMTLAVGDEFKVFEDNGTAEGVWHPGADNYVVDADHVGEATIYFRPNGKEGWYYTVIYVAMKEEPQPTDWSEVLFVEPAAADDIAEDATFGLLDSEFSITITDPENKMAIDANPCRFGTAEGYKSYSHRLKTGGKSTSSKNYMTANIPAAGYLRIAVRTGKNEDITRNLVITQSDTLYNNVVKEADAIEVIEGESTVKVYPYITVPVAAGTVKLSYPTNGLNFYAFGFMASGTTAINNTAAEMKAVKMIENGQLVIIKNGVRYNVMGTAL